jgi:hypothetical protein
MDVTEEVTELILIQQFHCSSPWLAQVWGLRCHGFPMPGVESPGTEVLLFEASSVLNRLNTESLKL